MWRGQRDRDGYPIGADGRPEHRTRWEAEHGALAPDRELDHLCRRRSCVALAHLEPVTRAVNERRKAWRYRARLAACRVGHDLWLHGRVTPEGGRVCRVCSGV